MYLDEILAHKRAAWREAPTESPGHRETPAIPGTLAAALRRDTVAIIAEVKPKSPSKGPLWPAERGVELARDYARYGASAVSVLADDRFFGGSPELVASVAADEQVTVPVMYKDFVVDIRQVRLAWASGADALLVIARALDYPQLRDVCQAATEFGLDVLVETFTEEDLGLALDVGASIIGINNRDLQTFAVDLDNSTRLRQLIPDEVVTVSESGIVDVGDVKRLADFGFDACLIGETLLASGSLGTTLGELAGVASQGGAR